MSGGGGGEQAIPEVKTEGMAEQWRDCGDASTICEAAIELAVDSHIPTVSTACTAAEGEAEDVSSRFSSCCVDELSALISGLLEYKRVGSSRSSDAAQLKGFLHLLHALPKSGIGAASSMRIEDGLNYTRHRGEINPDTAILDNLVRTSLPTHNIPSASPNGHHSQNEVDGVLSNKKATVQGVEDAHSTTTVTVASESLKDGLNEKLSNVTADEVSMTDEFPVVIVGAGPVGLTIALLLAHNQIRSVVLEQAESVSPAPRAVGFLGPVHEVFKESGIYEQLAREGAQNGGEIWRNGPVVDDGKGGMKLSEIVADHTISSPDANGEYALGEYFIMIPQSRLASILLSECLKTGYVTTRFNSAVQSLTQDDAGVSVGVESTTDGSKSTISGQYLAGCDGGRSTIRKLLGITLAGHAWPERFIALNVKRTAPTLPDHQIQYTVHQKYWGVVAALEKLELGKIGMWRYALAVTDDTVSDEDIMSYPRLDDLLLKQMDGPRPAKYEIVNKALYRTFNALATTMHRGRCLLAGDAAHSNTPIGAMGLNTGFLDAGALAQTLDMAIRQHHPEPQKLFASYSARRRLVFQNIVHPISSANKLRLHSTEPDVAKKEDWYFQTLNSGDDAQVKEMFRPMWEDWKTDMNDSPQSLL